MFTQFPRVLRREALHINSVLNYVGVNSAFRQPLLVKTSAHNNAVSKTECGTLEQLSQPKAQTAAASGRPNKFRNRIAGFDDQAFAEDQFVKSRAQYRRI